MSSLMKYKGYSGNVEFSEADGVFFGEIQGIRSVITYEGTNSEELLKDFHDSVDVYLEFCKSQGIAPETPYKGSLNVRFKDKNVHRDAAIYAKTHNQSLNSFIEEAVIEKLARVNNLQTTK